MLHLPNVERGELSHCCRHAFDLVWATASEPVPSPGGRAVRLLRRPRRTAVQPAQADSGRRPSRPPATDDPALRQRQPVDRCRVDRKARRTSPTVRCRDRGGPRPAVRASGMFGIYTTRGMSSHRRATSRSDRSSSSTKPSTCQASQRPAPRRRGSKEFRRPTGRTPMVRSQRNPAPDQALGHTGTWIDRSAAVCERVSPAPSAGPRTSPSAGPERYRFEAVRG